MMMPSVARVKFIKTKVIFMYHTKGISNQVSSKSTHRIKYYLCSSSSTKMGKNCQKWVTKRGNKGITNRAALRDCRSGQEWLQILVALRISNQGNKITNRGRKFESGQGLQIGVRGISNQARDFKSEQGLQIGREQRVAKCLKI